MKKIKLLFFAVLLITTASAQNVPTILINSASTYANSIMLPYMLPAGTTVNIENYTLGISIDEFNIVAVNGVNQLQFNSTIIVSSAQTVPSGEVWKITGIA